MIAKSKNGTLGHFLSSSSMLDEMQQIEMKNFERKSKISNKEEQKNRWTNSFHTFSYNNTI